MRLAAIAFSLAALVPGFGLGTEELRAQAIPAIAQTEVERAACRRWPLIFQAYGSRGDSYVHKDSVSGASCLIPPPPPRPTAVTVDGKVSCPGPDSTSWREGPPSWRDPGAERIDQIEIIRDSTVLLALRCRVRPVALVRVLLKPAPS
jgi:hypothetical protein